jgi:hypothetical protein
MKENCASHKHEIQSAENRRAQMLDPNSWYSALVTQCLEKSGSMAKREAPFHTVSSGLKDVEIMTEKAIPISAGNRQHI